MGREEKKDVISGCVDFSIVGVVYSWSVVCVSIVLFPNWVVVYEIGYRSNEWRVINIIESSDKSQIGQLEIDSWEDNGEEEEVY